MKPRNLISHIRLILLGGILLAFGRVGYAQTEMSSFNLYGQLGVGFGLEATVNAEFRVSEREKVAWYARAGAGYGGVIISTGGPSITASMVMLSGKGKNHFEMNGGILVGKDLYYNEVFYLPIINLGYRYQKPEGGFLFKAKVGFLDVGLGMGYAF